MGLVINVRKKLDFIERKLSSTLTSYSEHKNVKRKKNLIDKVNLTSEQEREIDKFFEKNYGKKIDKSWHKLYESYAGKHQYNYFPEILFSTKLEPLTNPRREAELFGDKNLLYTLFGKLENLHIPKLYISCVNGFVRNSENMPIELEKLCREVPDGKYVIKKTIDTSSGRDVMICNLKNGIDSSSQKSLYEICLEFGNNFCVQECIKQWRELEKLYPKALNTFRIITYIVENKIYVAPMALRLARGGADRDNIHYGGIVVGIDNEGNLREKAFSEMGDSYLKHPDTNIVFKNYCILKVAEIADAAVRCHECIPWLGILSWDFSLDEKGIPVLIELNSTGQSAWFPQMCNGEPLFGEHTAYMLQKIKK